MSLNEQTIEEAFDVPACGQSVGRALIDGCMVIYDLDDPPVWLRAVIRAQDENGNTTDALRVYGDDGSFPYTVVECRNGTAITGVLA